jgi:negative regulator of flagellin synthesis FlgM
MVDRIKAYETTRTNFEATRLNENQAIKQEEVKKTQVQAQEKQTGARTVTSLSEEGKLRSDAMSALNKVPDIRNEKIQQIKNQIDNNTYNVPPEKVAEKMVNKILGFAGK